MAAHAKWVEGMLAIHLSWQCVRLIYPALLVEGRSCVARFVRTVRGYATVDEDRVLELLEDMMSARSCSGKVDSSPHLYIYNLLNIDETDHKGEKIKSHITRAQRMCQTARKPSCRESEEPQQRSARKKKGRGELAEKPEESAEKESETSSGQRARGERNKRRPSGGLSDPDHAQSQNARNIYIIY